MRQTLLVSAALSGAMAVAMGAFATHGFAEQGHERAAGLFETASRYQMWHALAALAVLAHARQGRLAPAMLLSGSLVFALSLYALGLGSPVIVGLITPIGGLMMITGWLVTAWQLFRADLV